jgi:hypothetical protein
VPKEKPSDPQNSAVLAICTLGAAALIGGFVYFKVKACRPKYYCLEDEDGNRFASNATRTERAANDWKVKSGPYNSAEEAHKYCPPKTNSAVNLVLTSNSEVEDDPSVYIPAIPIKIWRSTNLVDWVLRDTILDDPSHFSWMDTNAISANSRAFYKASY